MKTLLSPLTAPTSGTLDAGLLLLRVSSGLHMATLHGWGKFSMLLSGDPTGFPDPLGIGSGPSLFLASTAELFGGIALALGLFTRLATVPLLITMLVAVFLLHGGQPWAERESAVVYLTMYATLALTGPGRWSLDALLHDRVQASED